MVFATLAATTMVSCTIIRNGSTSHNQVTTATNHIAEALITARNTAITNQAIVRVERRTFEGKEQLFVKENGGPNRAEKNWLIELGSRVSVEGSPQELEFMPTGSASQSLTWTIKQTGSEGLVTVASASGQIIRKLP